ncbi:hypothetical protein [Mesorhizobium sp.]|uniref:hypothetical protein n=1 Tax=Mesorhizobium sp. TaxID=1871066 RepID=UPI00257F980D|nr:hypothetical protein [Mesorhizobium sp.]
MFAMSPFAGLHAGSARSSPAKVPNRDTEVRRVEQACGSLVAVAGTCQPGRKSFAAELLRRLAEVGRDGIAVEIDDTASGRTGTVDHAPSSARNFADAKRMRDAIDVALALLDEILELTPGEPEQAVASDIAEIFREISEIAARGESAARKAIAE